MFAWGGTGLFVGGMLGAIGAGFAKPAVGESSMGFIARSSAITAGELAGIAAVFAVTDSVLSMSSGPSPVNSAMAGCAAGSLLGFRAGSAASAAYGCGMFASLQLFGGYALALNGDAGH
jgi:hypothetical protein